MQLHRTYGGCHDDITSIDWSADGLFMAVASKDLTAHVFSLHPIEGYSPPTLTGHKDGLIGVYFTHEATQTATQLAGQVRYCDSLITAGWAAAATGIVVISTVMKC